MSTAVRLAYGAEMEKGMRARSAGDLNTAFTHFERAHILGQRFTWLHIRAHAATHRQISA